MAENARFSCVVCGNGAAFQWTDTHGVAVHVPCGMPYRVLHYEGEGDDLHLVEKPPECAILPEWIEAAQAYWKEAKRMVFPGTYDMGILGGREATYSGATQEDHEAFWDWVNAHPEFTPQESKEAQ